MGEHLARGRVQHETVYTTCSNAIGPITTLNLWLRGAASFRGQIGQTQTSNKRVGFGFGTTAKKYIMALAIPLKPLDTCDLCHVISGLSCPLARWSQD